MSAKHTPGPWAFQQLYGRTGGIGIDANEGRDPIGHLYAFGTAPEHDNDPGFRALRDRAVANARLVAAAPDLLEALQKARVAVALYSPNPTEPLEEIDAAIAKATGEAS